MPLECNSGKDVINIQDFRGREGEDRDTSGKDNVCPEVFVTSTGEDALDNAQN